ncbi:hypothetical protein HMPREF0645_0280 [Hallella bergensis DSM 17361]|uniref:Uncharacterized protein n=1 Tax=Hallella bergensis DSM 17361 TaxID=585502 RepID=D1PTJ5_9BACT|nr:hypothetical protein HMPREF0645_0280 [Hallella bergensis DSM 17361]
MMFLHRKSHLSHIGCVSQKVNTNTKLNIKTRKTTVYPKIFE